MNSEDLFLANLKTIDEAIRFVCRQKHATRDEFEDFTGDVRLKLFADDCRILREHKGRASLRTYLQAVISRQWIDRERREGRRFHASSQARELGDLAVELERLLVRDGLKLEEATSILLTHHPERTAKEIEELADKLPPRIWHLTEEGEVEVNQQPQLGPSAEEHLLLKEAKEQALRALSRAVKGLPAEDKVIALLCARNVKLSQVARSLGLKQGPLYHRRDRIFHSLKCKIEETGLCFEDFCSALGIDLMDPERLKL